MFGIIKDTIKSPPENKVTKRASAIAVIVTSVFYLGCGCFGYAAFGNNTPGNLLTGFGFYEPYWIVDFANVCIIVHLIGGYQVNLHCFTTISHTLTFKVKYTSLNLKCTLVLPSFLDHSLS